MPKSQKKWTFSKNISQRISKKFYSQTQDLKDLVLPKSGGMCRISKKSRSRKGSREASRSRKISYISEYVDKIRYASTRHKRSYTSSFQTQRARLQPSSIPHPPQNAQSSKILKRRAQSSSKLQISNPGKNLKPAPSKKPKIAKKNSIPRKRSSSEKNLKKRRKKSRSVHSVNRRKMAEKLGKIAENGSIGGNSGKNIRLLKKFMLPPKTKKGAKTV